MTAGQVPATPPTDNRAMRRFLGKVDRLPCGGCWLWSAATNDAGYGLIHWRRRSYLAHRFAYENLVGDIPDGLELDHLCRVRNCVNPAHLEAVTRQVNALRGLSPSGIHARKTHCHRGHEFTNENTSIRPNGARRCLTCHRENERARHQRRRGAA